MMVEINIERYMILGARSTNHSTSEVASIAGYEVLLRGIRQGCVGLERLDEKVLKMANQGSGLLASTDDAVEDVQAFREDCERNFEDRQ